MSSAGNFSTWKLLFFIFRANWDGEPWYGFIIGRKIRTSLRYSRRFDKNVFSIPFLQVDLGNIDTEVLLKTIVQTELSRRKSLGSFRKGASFNCKTHFLAYQGRSALPTAFDCDLGCGQRFSPLSSSYYAWNSYPPRILWSSPWKHLRLPLRPKLASIYSQLSLHLFSLFLFDLKVFAWIFNGSLNWWRKKRLPC